jgi:hypothetical protein
VTLDQLRLQHQIKAALREAAEPGAAEPAPAERHAAPAISPAQASVAIAAVQRAIEDSAFDLHKLLLVILETTLTAGGFDRAVLALASTTHREVCGRFALGRDSEQLMLRFRFPIGVSGGPLGIAIGRGQEVTITREWELLPDEQRLLRTLGAGSLVLLPLSVEGRIIGGLYVDTERPARPGDASIAVARQMRDAIATAMARRRSPPVATRFGTV